MHASRSRFSHRHAVVFADEDRILQVLNELVSNAIKFSGPDTAINFTAQPAPVYETRIRFIEPGRSLLHHRRSRPWHSAGQAGAHLRSVPTGRCLRFTRAGRHRPGPRALPKHRGAARRPHLGREHSRTGQPLSLHTSGSPLSQLVTAGHGRMIPINSGVPHEVRANNTHHLP